MSILRALSATKTRRFYLFYVEPVGDYYPASWREQPLQYRIIKPAGTTSLRGKVDAWKWRINSRAITDGTQSHQWAIAVQGVTG